MVPLSDWTRTCPLPDRPWLILGKGPSFGRRHSIDLASYNLVSLNHVVREQRVDVAHFIDLDALVACADMLPTNAEWLMVPRYPHVAFQPSDRPLEQLVAEVPILRQFADRGRLVWYYHDLVSRPDLKERYPQGAAPLVRVDAFSAEAVVNLLAAIGVSCVRTLGIDGGIHYSRDFHDLNGVTRLANGQESFDKQFIGIHRTAKESGMDYGPIVDPIRVYVGTDDTQMAAVQVLEYSIRRFATRPVEVVPLLNLPTPMPRDPANRPRTGFSFARFLIPSLAGYRGKAIYVDADMLVFGDIADLWDTPMGSNRVLCTRQDAPPLTWQNNAQFKPGRQMSVMLIDCEKCDWKIENIVRGLDEGTFNYSQLMSDLCIVPPGEVGETLDPMWNCLEHFTAGKTKLLHFTDMDMQPWRHQHNPLKSIWRAYFRAAVESGAVDPGTVTTGIANGWLLPELAEDLRRAPSRRQHQAPASAALDGEPSVRQRSLELENAALRAELGLARLEAEISRSECYRQYVELCQKDAEVGKKDAELGKVQAHAGGLVSEVADRTREVSRLGLVVAELEQRLASLQGSWSWTIGQAMTKPIRAVKSLKRRAA